ncbi:MAG: hypothetical protein ACYS8W_01690 [Planctomycetota bacterium]
MPVGVSPQSAPVHAGNPNERVWAMLPVERLLHAGEKFLAFTTEAVYVFGAQPAADPSHPGKKAYMFEDDFSSPPLPEMKACFRQTALFRHDDIRGYGLVRDGLSYIFVLKTDAGVRRFPLIRGAGSSAKKIVKVLSGRTENSPRKWFRPAGISLLFLGLLLTAAPGVSLYISLPLIAAGGTFLVFPDK